MYPHQQNGAGRGGMLNGPLEDHLRNLILANNDGNGRLPESPNMAQAPASLATAAVPPLGPGAPSPTTAARPVSAASPKTRKRPNQAQRRQMSAQLSVPVDWQASASSHPIGNFGGPLPYGGQNQQHRPPHPRHHQNNSSFNSQHSYHHNQQSHQRPQSATMRPSNYGYGPMSANALPGDAPYPSQPRHQQSLSYQGPMGYDDPYNWRSHPSPAQSFNAPGPRNSRPPNNSNGRLYSLRPEEILLQSAALEKLCEKILASAEIEPGEIQEKESFRARIELLCQEALGTYEREVNGRTDFAPSSVRLKCFGSLSSGFATKASDMDLGLVSPMSDPQPDTPKSPIPRLIEKAFLDAGLGARLLSRTRVPIIKLCEKPPEKLRLDLLEERAKWERGLLPEHDELEVDDDAGDEHEHAPGHNREVSAGDDKPKHAHKESDLDNEGEDKHGQNSGHLRQPTGQTLGNYYSAAKRTLRKLGGRDITHSTVREFSDKDLKLLTDVCHMFVAGLADEGLKGRLLATRSLATSDTPSQPNYRSLYGVYMQAEGERLAMLWEAREIHEKGEALEDEAREKIRAWKELQNKPVFSHDLLGYNKEIQLAVDSLRKIPSLQVVTLEQGQFESAAQYHDRVNRLLQQSGGRDNALTQNNTLLGIVIHHYINGIYNADVRAEVEKFAASMDSPSLRAVARRHKSLQLAVEFERALAKGYYEASSRKTVEAYIEVLRLPLEKSEMPGRRFDYVVPRNAETAGIIAQARQLADPSKFAPNQPRDPYRDKLEFPKTGLGVQCDINVSAHLALQNTRLMRCYSHTDPRVRPIILFVKHWSKIRGINTPYRGTLSSYGYVLMVLHYLVNIAQPFVCPNLQQLAKPVPEGLSAEEVEETVTCRGRDVRFWRDEKEIQGLAMQNLLNQNTDSIGHLLRGFFEYYAQNNFMSTVPCRGFDWGRDVLSLRTPGGLRSKKEKGWTGARTVLVVRDQVETPAVSSPKADAGGGTGTGTGTGTAGAGTAGAGTSGTGTAGTAGTGTTDPQTSPGGPKAAAGNGVEMKEVKHRFLFAIEDPFEHEHNVARTVTHMGIVAIRDEFRRAWRIIKNVGKATDEELLADVSENKTKERDHFADLMYDIHGPEASGSQ